MGKDIFISYATEDENTANWVRACLEKNGLSCWLAPISIPGGADYATEIPKAIAQCRFFVLIFSANTQLSKWVPKELDQAINEGKTVLPFMIEDCPIVPPYEFYFRNVQYYYAYQDQLGAMKKLIADIFAQMNQPAPTPRVAPRRKRKAWPWIALAALLLVLILLANRCGLHLEFTRPTEESTPPAQTAGHESTPGETTQSTQPVDSTIFTTEPSEIQIDPIPTNTEAAVIQDTTPATKPNYSRADAYPIQFSDEIDGMLDNQAHWYKFTTGSDRAAYRIFLSAKNRISGNHTYDHLKVALYESNGIKIQDDTIPGYETDTFFDLYLEPNTQYCVKIEGPGNYSDNLGTGPYTLCVSEFICDAGMDQESATELLLGVQHSGFTDTTLADIYTYTSQKSGSYRFTLHNIDVGCDLRLTVTDSLDGGSFCSVLAKNEDNDDNRCYLSAGEIIYIQIYPYKDDPIAYGEYIVIIEEC